MSIKHFEDLPIKELREILDTLSEYEPTEKLDGSRLLFGLDEQGQFYTSRGNNKVYSVTDYEINFSTTFQRFGHLALQESHQKLLAAGMLPGDQVEVEVLHGELPNVVPYSKDTSYIIFLRTTAGTANIDRLESEFSGHSLSLALLSPFTESGKEILYKTVNSTWKFARTPVIEYNSGLLEHYLRPKIKALDKFLQENSGYSGLSNHDLATLNLSKIKVGVDREVAKTIREEARITIRTQYIGKIKEVLLDHIVRRRGSKFGSVTHGWIEGVVMRHKKTGKMFKLIDKDIFGIAHKFVWQVRNAIDRSSNREAILSLLDKYDKEHRDMKIHIPEIGQILSYTGQVDNRTREVFAYRLNQVSDEIR